MKGLAGGAEPGAVQDWENGNLQGGSCGKEILIP